jgi:16S rRNA (uracil1498-N3)-methyltransferase
MLPRFLVPDFDLDRREAVVRADEAHHLTRVLRLVVGSDVRVFDGHGREFVARVASIGPAAVTVSLLEPVDTAAAPSVALTLVQSILKGESMDSVVRDCTMIGIESVQPIVSERTTVKASVLPKAVERWRRVALSSSKQCGRSTLPAIHDPIDFNEWVRRPREEPAYVLVEPAVAAELRTVKVRDLFGQPIPERATLIVGPEGGWSPAERDRAIQAGAIPLSLGRLTLRADAAPLAASSTLLAIWDK